MAFDKKGTFGQREDEWANYCRTESVKNKAPFLKQKNKDFNMQFENFSNCNYFSLTPYI